MQHLIFATHPKQQYKTAIFIKEAALVTANLSKHYIDPLVNKNLNKEDFIAFGLKYNEHNKAPVKLIKEQLDTVLKGAQTVGVKTILCCDSAYFKTLTKSTKAEPHHGYILPCKIKGYEHMEVVLSVNYQALFYNPSLSAKLILSLETLTDHINCTHVPLGTNIIHSADYPETLSDVEYALRQLHDHPELVCDIETFSLNFWEADIATIGFAWDKHNGMAFDVSFSDRYYDTKLPIRKQLLKEFFLTYKGKIIYHGGTFDIKVLIYELFMSNMQDTPGLIHGLNTMYKNIDDTLIITYLATNTTAGNVLGLKPNTFEYTGNYTLEEIEDIKLYTVREILEYNLTDCLATWYLKEKYEPIMIADQQQQIHDEIFIPSMKVITQMELNGMPMDMQTIFRTNSKLQSIQKTMEKVLLQSPIIKAFEWQQARKAMIVKNLLLKTKVKPIADFLEPYNPASNKQTQELLYEYLGFPIEDKTATGQPAVGTKTIKKILVKLMADYNISEEDLK